LIDECCFGDGAGAGADDDNGSGRGDGGSSDVTRPYTATLTQRVHTDIHGHVIRRSYQLTSLQL
jgi:hypothetical protein